MGENAEYVAMMEAQLKKWDADLDALDAKGEGASAEARASYHLPVKSLRASRDAAQRTFLELRGASVAIGAQNLVAMEAAWRTMQKALEKVSSQTGK